MGVCWNPRDCGVSKSGSPPQLGTDLKMWHSASRGHLCQQAPIAANQNHQRLSPFPFFDIHQPARPFVLLSDLSAKEHRDLSTKSLRCI